MSASDAAPLPRLGEVFFDVRGNSRSMRLSWYADTGVAVLSIWQGGMCTGTFRLAIADLPRMVQTLQRGPDGQQPGWDGEASGQAFADAPGDATAQVRAMGPMSGQMMQPPGHPDQAADHVPGPGPVGYPGEPLPADPRGGAPDYRAEPPDPRSGPLDSRSGPTEYPAAPTGRRGGSGQYPAESPRPMPEPAAGPPGYPGEAQPPDRRGGAPDYLADPLEVLGQLGVPEAPAAAPAPYQNGAPEYLAAPSPGQRPRPADYLNGPPPEQQPDYLNGPSGYQPAGPPQQGTEYPANLPAAPNAESAGYGADFHAGGSPGGSYPGAGDSGSYPGAGDSGAYPRGTGHQDWNPGEQASDPYLPGGGPMDYQGETPVSHYPGVSSVPRSNPRSSPRSAPRSGPGSAAQGDPLGPSTADYPVHYGAALTDDMADEPPLETFPYQPRRGSR